MKLEAVNPVDPEEVCIATVTKLRDSYLWLQLEGKPDVGEEKSACVAASVVPSSNLTSVLSKLTACWIWAANHRFLNENSKTPFARSVSQLALDGGWLFQPGKNGLCVLQRVSARLVHSLKCWVVAFRKEGPCNFFTNEWLVLWASFDQI